MSGSWDEFLAGNGLSGSGGGSQAGWQGALGGALNLAGPVGTAASAFTSFVASIAGQFGRGRREADLIVPVQEEFGRVLQVVNQQMDAGGLNRNQLIEWQGIVARGYAEFDAFTRDARFTDGRASVQARNTIRPLVDGRNDAGQVVRQDGGTLGNLQRRIDQLGGGGGYVNTPTGLAPVSSFAAGPTQPGAAPGVGQDSTLLYVGAAALAAKLLL
jgi:hypothetical protein